jgi:hypothetical protein
MTIIGAYYHHLKQSESNFGSVNEIMRMFLEFGAQFGSRAQLWQIAESPGETDFWRETPRAFHVLVIWGVCYGALTSHDYERKHGPADVQDIQANRRRRPSTFAVGDLVLLSTRNLVYDTYTGARKLMPKFCGPFAITAKINDVTYRLDLSVPMLARGIHNAFHAKLLRPYHPDTAFERTPVAPPPIQFPDGDTEYEAEQFVRYRLHRGSPQI